MSDEIKEKYPDIPWREMGGMRDMLIHEYFGIKVEVVKETVKSDLPYLKKEITKVLKNEQKI